MKQPMLLQNNRGFSLIEVMVAFVILIIGLLGLLQAVNVAMLHNLQNQMREEAVSIASSVVHEMRNRPFGTAPNPVYEVSSKKIRGVNAKYSVLEAVEDASTGVTVVSHKYQVKVDWQLKGQTFTHTAVTVRSNRE